MSDFLFSTVVTSRRAPTPADILRAVYQDALRGGITDWDAVERLIAASEAGADVSIIPDRAAEAMLKRAKAENQQLHAAVQQETLLKVGSSE